MSTSKKPQSRKGHHSMKHKFSKVEDDLILKMVEENGIHYWPKIAKKLGNRTARQCRERWKHYLKPGIDSSPWTTEEDQILIELYNEFGPKWSILRGHLPGRTDVNIKNRWSLISRKANKPPKSHKKTKTSKPKNIKNNRQDDRKVSSKTNKKKANIESSDSTNDSANDSNDESSQKAVFSGNFVDYSDFQYDFDEILKEMEINFASYDSAGALYYQDSYGSDQSNK